MKVGKLHIMHVDEVDIVDVQSFHAFINTVGNAFRGIVPCVLSVFSVSPHLCRKIILVALNIYQCLSEHCFRLQMSVIGRNINKVDAVLHCRMHSLYSFCLADVVEYSSERRSSEAKVRHTHACFSYFIINHNRLFF